MLTSSRSLTSCAFWQVRYLGGTDGTIDNEQRNTMILNDFSPSTVSGTRQNKRRFAGTKCPKMLDKGVALWHNVIVTLEHCHTTLKERMHQNADD